MTGTPATPAKVWTIRELLAWSRSWFERRDIDSPRLTGEILLAHVLNVPRIKLYAEIDKPVNPEELACYRALIQRRTAGEPTQYIVGTQDFYGRTFKADRRALIPRPETELVVERVLRAFDRSQAATFADIGCGSGIMGLTLAAERREARVVLTDVSAEALALARENAVLLDVAARVDPRLGDLTAPLGDLRFDAIVANLPYVASGERHALPVHIREHEPETALFAGEDGLDLYRRFLPAIGRHLELGGLLVVEHGAEQGDRVRDLFAPESWLPPATEADLAGLDRFTWALRR